jgi:putative transposase
MKSRQMFASVNANVDNHFNLERHLVDRKIFEGRRVAVPPFEWRQIASWPASIKYLSLSWSLALALD